MSENNKALAKAFARKCKGAFPMEISLDQLSTLAASFAEDIRRAAWTEAIAVVVGFPTERHSSGGAHLVNALTFRDGVVKALETAAGTSPNGKKS